MLRELSSWVFPPFFFFCVLLVAFLSVFAEVNNYLNNSPMDVVESQVILITFENTSPSYKIHCLAKLVYMAL